MESSVLEFRNVALDKLENLSFSISAGVCRILEVPSAEVKSAVIEMVLGEFQPANGVVLLHGQPVETCEPGCTAWIGANGGLISNLKAWENITLPLWFHRGRQVAVTEEAVKHWLIELKLDQQEWEKFMASPAARLKLWERKLAGLLRGLVQAPQLLVIDADLFDEVDEAKIQVWINALELYVREAAKRGVLVIANGNTMLPWNKIE